MIANSLRLAFDLFCIAAGLSSILLAVLVYFRTPSRLIAHHIATVGLWTLNQLLLTTFFYLNAILGLSDPRTNAAINDASYFASGLFAALLIRLLHEYFRREPNAWMKILAAVCAIGAFIPTTLLSYSLPPYVVPIGVVEAAKLLSLYAALFSVAWYLHRFSRTVSDSEIRRMLMVLVALQVVFYPVMLWEGRRFFQGEFFTPISSFSLFYGLTNLLWLYFVSRHIEFPVVQFVSDGRSLERFVTLFDISGREVEIIRLLLDGKSYKEIARQLYIAHETVKTHVNNIYRKAGVRSKMELAKMVRNS